MRKRLRREVDAGVADRCQLGDDLDQPFLHRRAVGGHRSRLDVALQPLDDLGSGRGADVGEDQQLLEMLPGLVVDAVEDAGRDLLGQRLATAGETLAQAAEDSLALLALFDPTLAIALGDRAFAEVEDVVPAHRHRGRLAS